MTIGRIKCRKLTQHALHETFPFSVFVNYLRNWFTRRSIVCGPNAAPLSHTDLRTFGGFAFDRDSGRNVRMLQNPAFTNIATLQDTTLLTTTFPFFLHLAPLLNLNCLYERAYLSLNLNLLLTKIFPLSHSPYFNSFVIGPFNFFNLFLFCK